MPVYAGFDLGATQLKYGLINEDNSIILEGKVRSPHQKNQLIELIKHIWEKLKKESKISIQAAGLGFPGIFNIKEQKILQSPNYPELDGLEIRRALEPFIEIPFFINNDANMAAFGEYKLGSGKDVQSLILITIGTGIGSGIILEGKLWMGVCGFAGELGHITVNPDGEQCNCGNRGCLEKEVSASKIVKIYKHLSGSGKDLSSKEIFLRAERNDVHAIEAFAQAGRSLGIGLAATLNIFNPSVILLGGEVMKASKFLLPHALQEAQKRAYKACYECCKIERAILGNDAGYLGAALWAKENYSRSNS